MYLQYMPHPRPIQLLVLALSASLLIAQAAATGPRLTIKPADLARARANIERYEWAKKYRDRVVRAADAHVRELDAAAIERFVETTTPISTIFTPCPACRDQGKTWHPHGQWQWSARDVDRLACKVCETVFPNEKYPETIAIHTTWGTPQTFTFVGGEPFVVFSNKTGRSSLSGNIRSRKVNHVTDACRTIAEAYLLTDDTPYAQTVRLILLRLAKVYPHWLIHSGYGDFVDMDPRIAAPNINKLPAEEVVYPPIKPDRKLHTGFWTAGRATGRGQESAFVRAVAFAYDSTRDSGVFSDEEKRVIEKDLLIESTVLLVADKQINNKSVGNRTAAAMVGLVVDDAELVKFGVEGFHQAVTEWFLPDGGTPESAVYAVMTLANTIDMPLALRDLFQNDAYARAWGNLIDGLQGDLRYIPYADTQPKRRIDARWAEILAANYPDRPQYLALLKELSGDDLRDARADVAIYYREPGLEDRPSPPFALPDVCLPDLRIGHMRTGEHGRESLLLLSASHWGGHHHLDSLNLYYWKNGHELLTDLGYLWDNPKKFMNSRTLAHNTVILDEADQVRDRGGKVHFFKTSPNVKVMRASSEAYEQAKRYERTSAIIDHGEGRNYVVDVFTVEGGRTQDFIFHGPHQDFVVQKATTRPHRSHYDLSNVRALATKNFWRIVWKMDERNDFTAWSIPQEHEAAFIGDGWGQRDSYNADQGVTIPYVVRRTSGKGLKQFVSVFELHGPEQPFVRAVRRTKKGVEVETATGRDYIECADRFSVTSDHWSFEQ